MIKSTLLSNGLNVVTEQMPNVESVAIGFWVGTGSRDESDTTWGTSHFLEHLLFKGTTSRSALDIARTIDFVGGDMNAFTTKELTAFYVRVVRDEVAVGLEMLCDIMSNPAFDSNEIECERGVVLEEILMRNDEPADLVHELYDEVAFGDHRLSREILGSEDQIENMSRELIADFFAEHYRPNNLVVAAAGAVEHDEFVSQLQANFKPGVGGTRPVRTAPTQLQGVRRVCSRPTDQVHLVVGFGGPDRHSSLRYSTAVLDVVLGGGMSSRLFQAIREKRGLAYTVGSSFVPYDDTGTFCVYLGTAPKKAATALDVLLDEIATVATDGITQDELLCAKKSLHANMVLNLEDSGSRMSRIGRSLLQHGSVLEVSEVLRRIDAVTVDDVAKVAAMYLQSAPNVVAVGPVDENLKPRRGKATAN